MTQSNLISKERIKENRQAFESLDSILGEVLNPKPFVDPNSKVVSSDSFNTREVDLPESFVAQITGKRLVESKKQIEEQVEEEQEEEISEDLRESTEVRIRNLVLQLKMLLEEAHSVVQEVTTTGMIGTNQKFVLGKKNGSNKANQRNKSKRR